MNYSTNASKVGVYGHFRVFKKDYDDASVKSTMIHAGVNHRPRDNPVHVANKICRLMVHTSEESPNTLIYFSAIFPNFGRSFNSMINYGNNEVFNFCLDNQKMKFIQYSNFAVNHNLNYDYFWKDKIHKTHTSNISLRQLTTRLYFKYKGKVRRVLFCLFVCFYIIL